MSDGQGYSIFEQFNSGVESLFSTLGNITDGAASIFGDYLEFEQLWKNEKDQGSQALDSAFSWGQPTTQTTSTPILSGAGGSNMLVYAAFGLVAIAGISLLTGK